MQPDSIKQYDYKFSHSLAKLQRFNNKIITKIKDNKH